MNDYIIEVIINIISGLDFLGIIIIIASFLMCGAFLLFGGMLSERMSEDDRKICLKTIIISCIFMLIGAVIIVLTPSEEVLHQLICNL